MFLSVVVVIANDTDVQMFTLSSTFIKLQIRINWLLC